MSIKSQLNEAEKKARKRDFENEFDLNEVANQEHKANELGYGIYKIKDKHKANFTQSNNDNYLELIKNDYFTDKETALLAKLQTLVEFDSNAIVCPKTKQALNVSNIAKLVKRSRSTVSPIIQKLLEKGALFELVNQQEIKKHKRNVTSRALFMNPEIYYSGDRNKINSTLARITITNDVFEREGIKFKWKVWLKSGNKHGKLYERKTYLKLKKE